MPESLGKNRRLERMGEEVDGEKVFGTLKRIYGYSRERYRGLVRNGVEMWFKLMAYNLRKLGKLAGAAA